MGAYAFDREPDYVGHVARNDWAGAQHCVGVDDGWDMPVALFDVRGGFENRAQPGSIGHHTLKWCVDGSTVHARSGRTSARSDGPAAQGVCIQPRNSNAVYWCDGDMRCAHLYCSDLRIRALASELHDEMGDRPDLLCDDVLFSGDPALSAMAFSYFRRALSDDRPSALEMDTRCLALTSQLVTSHSTMRGVKRRTRGYRISPRQIGKVIDLFMDHLADAPRLADVASEIGMTSFHFCRAFHRAVGMPPHRWLLAVRVERAKVLLTETDKSISDIAAVVGYDDPSYFARVFKRYAGMSPLQLRKQG